MIAPDHTLLVHVGYALMLCALLARDILWLRAVLAAAQTNLCLYAVFHGLQGMAAWNGLFVLINLVWVLRIVRERRAVVLPADLREWHARHFAALAPGDFLRLWEQGALESLSDVILVSEGEKPGALYFILEGQVLIAGRGHVIANLGPGDFVGEMSLLTGEPATADARAPGAVRMMTWPTERLLEIKARDPVLWSRIQSVLGHDIVEKIKRQSTLRAALH